MSMELYIHIPFCVRKCDYCDFLSGPAGRETQEAYVEALKREIRMVGQRHRELCQAAGKRPEETEVRQSLMPEPMREHPGKIVTSVFIGGGTPSVIEADWIAGIMEEVRAAFLLAEDAEITMEANPGTLTKEKLAVYRSAGINRLSLGLQSADDEELKCLGRIHTWQDFLDNYRLARAAGFTNINIDLMSALPGQTEESYERTLRRVIALEPEHISAYSLIIEEGTPFWDRYGTPENREGQALLPGEEADRRMYYRTGELLKEAGYDRYEISNYARPGFACRHNVGYWTRVPYLGLGLGAASLYEGQRFSNTCSMEEYLQAADPEELRRDVQVLTEKDAVEEFMFLGLRLTAGVSASNFRQAFGTELETVYGALLEKLARQGLMERAGGEDPVWKLTARGLDISNYVLAQFLLEDEI